MRNSKLSSQKKPLFYLSFFSQRLLMNKRGVSIIVSVVLLIALSISLAFAIYSYSLPIIGLSPEVDCYGLDFRAEIIGDNLEVVNIGNLPIKGFYLKKISNGELVIFEEVLHDVAPGATERITLSKEYLSDTYFIVPRVEGMDGNEQPFIGACRDLYGFDVVV